MLVARRLILTATRHTTVPPFLIEVAKIQVAIKKHKEAQKLVPTPIQNLFPKEVQTLVGYLFQRLKSTAQRESIEPEFQKAWQCINEGVSTPFDPTNTNLLTYRLYEVLIDLIDFAKHYYYFVKKEREIPLTPSTQSITEVLNPILTRHPCLMKHPETMQIGGKILDRLDAPNDAEIEELIKQLLALPYGIQNFTLKSEIEINANYVLTLIWAASLIETMLGLKPGSILKAYSWTGIEADRNANTSGVVGLTLIVMIQRVIKFLREKIKLILENNPSAITKESLENLEKKLKDIEEVCKLLWRLGKTLPTIDIKRFPRKHKFVQDNIKQLFPEASNGSGETLKTIEDFWKTSKDKFKLSDDLVKARTETEKLLEEYYIKVFAKEKDLEKAISHLLEILSDEKEIKSIRELQHFIRNAGLNPAKGQGRLDSKEVVKQAAEDLLKQEELDALKDSDEVTKILHALQNPKIPTNSEIATLDPETQETFNHFKIMRIVNMAGENIPILVLANFSSPEDFLRALYLAAKAGLVEIKDGKVINSKLLIVPLLESVDDHYHAGEVFDKLFSNPLIHSYYLSTGEVCIMSAYSDTPRQDGLSAARFAITLGSQQTYNAYKNHFKDTHVIFTRQHGNGSHGGRSGGYDIDNNWPLMPFEYYGHRRTWQPGNPLDRRASTTGQAFLAIKAALRAPVLIEEFSSEFINFMKRLIQPGMDYYRALTKDADGEFNKFLLCLHEAWEVLNKRPLGSRTKPHRDLHELPASIVWGERMITVTQLFDVLGLEIPTIVPFAISMQHINGEDLKKMQQLYKNNIFFKAWIDKIEEQIFNSFSEVWRYYRAYNPKLVDHITALFEQSQKDILAITGQKKLLENRPALEVKLSWARLKRQWRSRMTHPLYHADNPMTSKTSTIHYSLAEHRSLTAARTTSVAGHATELARIATARSGSVAFYSSAGESTTTAVSPKLS